MPTNIGHGAARAKSNPSRRTILSLTAATASAIVAQTALAAPTHPDAELIRLCDRLVAIYWYREAFYKRNMEDDERDAMVAPVDREWFQITARLQLIGRPSTQEGAVAMARAVRVTLDHRFDGAPIATEVSEWLAATVCAWMTGDPAPASEWSYPAVSA